MVGSMMGVIILVIWCSYTPISLAHTPALLPHTHLLLTYIGHAQYTLCIYTILYYTIYTPRPNIGYEVRYKDLLGQGRDEDILQVGCCAYCRVFIMHTVCCAVYMNQCTFSLHTRYFAQHPDAHAFVQDLVTWLDDKRGQTGIVYCTLRNTVDTVAKLLQDAGIDAEAYHAGKDTHTRARVQQNWSEVYMCVVYI